MSSWSVATETIYLLKCIVAVPASDVRSVRMAPAATEVRSFGSEEEMFHGFRDVLKEHGLSAATIALEKNFFDAALYEALEAGADLAHRRPECDHVDQGAT